MSETLHRQRERLARWLTEWQLEEALGQAVMPDASAAGGHKPMPNAPFPIAAPIDTEEAPLPGDIRLLSPEVTGPAVRPVFVAIL